MKYWAGGHWEKGERIIPDQECEQVVRLITEPNSSIVDLCCGDGNILEKVKNAYPNMNCIGIDLFIDNFKNNEILKQKGIKLYKESIETVVYNEFDKLPRDYIVMRNTFGTRHIKHINKDLEIAIFKHFRYFIAQRPPKNSPVIADYHVSHLNGDMHFSNTKCKISIIDETKNYYLIKNYGIEI